MSLYDFVKPLFFSFSPERAHGMAILALKNNLVPTPHYKNDPVLKTTLWGLDFPNPVGLAAGFDKNAEVPDAMLAQGFGFVEAGTVTPIAQAGNPKPRMFRLKEDAAVINRLGFNNGGLDEYVARLQKRDKEGILGANFGANKNVEDPAADYETGLKALLGLADYFTVNISSPNTPGLRKLQGRDALDDLIGRLMVIRDAANLKNTPPILVKIAPDLEGTEKEDIAEIILKHKVDGLIVSNTTIGGRDMLKSKYSDEMGGLSGVPLFKLSTEVLGDMYRLTSGKVTLIGVGGISTGLQAYQKIKAGASLVQLYSALVYHGPGLVRQINDELAILLKADGFSSVADAVGADNR
jgi:dihydroorotate dehydrogenase